MNKSTRTWITALVLFVMGIAGMFASYALAINLQTNQQQMGSFHMDATQYLWEAPLLYFVLLSLAMVLCGILLYIKSGRMM